MSLIGSLLAFVLIPLKARREERPKEVDNLAVMALADEVKRLQFALDFWRESARALMAENERLRRQRDAQYQQAQNAAMVGTRQLGQAQHNYQGVLLGQQMAAQNLYNQGLQQQSAFAGHCTCVPARADAFRNDNSQ